VRADEQKQLVRQRRERKLRLWLTTLSWSTPVIAFGSFFGIWHEIRVTSPTVHELRPKSAPLQSAVSQTTSGAKSEQKILFDIGSTAPEVRIVQEQLSLLGYFHHPITQYYGSLTADAVRAFQAHQHLPETGAVDQTTLTALQNAVKHVRIDSFTQSYSNSVKRTEDSTATARSSEVVHRRVSHRHHSSTVVPAQQSASTGALQNTGTGSAVVSQQSVPDATTSGS
jgi:peptidoglycan hydrolase-like protein with peptidoglycan-binding domain